MLIRCIPPPTTYLRNTCWSVDSPGLTCIPPINRSRHQALTRHVPCRVQRLQLLLTHHINRGMSSTHRPTHLCSTVCKSAHMLHYCTLTAPMLTSAVGIKAVGDA